MSHSLPYLVLAYYHFPHLPDPHAEVTAHKKFFEGRDVTCRIYISENGINGQMSASREDGQAYMDWMHARPEFKDMHFKLHEYHEHAFPRCTVKYRKQLVAVDERIDLSKRGEHVSPQRWKEMLEKKDDHILIDVRNDYEWKVGHFEGAELPPCETFKDFKHYVEDLKEKIDPQKTPVMMYCTGGIRCELYSSILIKQGFDKVYQLEGGIINYGLQEGSDYWLGKLFVFDDRLTVPISKEETKTIATCHHCNQPCDTYLNCANMDCNDLFICCNECSKKYLGCCQEQCQQAERVRPFQEDRPHKPFRKKHKYINIASNTPK
ncbi:MULTISPECIES: rhodanese-related sulfurtransferase [unclassified Neochlamydia]|uniref:oxygen-dependent tRNA uridine(34) hydroxylase TrhO n=1 Tax=unclassified Neochlamydia TaxID=2643326 RepID=UPI00140935F1|nr:MULTISPECIES: rhodanese-related sulfurtransferase [unclassified Neochlamydia]MBS4170196.1 UPF0176 protein [Neochlamydia sp. AcF95]NGY94965.1 UPF0176 protein [Neochlamydia sp. AcF84]